MRIFVTGAAGWVGSAVVPELISAGHQVVGLSRNEDNAKKLQAMGAEVHSGDLNDLDSLKKGAASCDAIIHLAFVHDFTDWAGNCAKDRTVIEALGSVLEGSDKPLIVTSGMTIIPSTPGTPAVESDAFNAQIPRFATEQGAAEVAKRGVVVSIIRLPPSVHGDGDFGFVPTIIKANLSKGVSPYVGEGKNRWPFVHRLDAAKLYRLVVEAKQTAGQLHIFHAVAEEGVAFREVAETIAKVHRIPARSISQEEANAHFGFLGHFVSANLPSSSARTRQQTGWTPTHVGIIEDLQQGSYASSASSSRGKYV